VEFAIRLPGQGGHGGGNGHSGDAPPLWLQLQLWSTFFGGKAIR